MVQQITADTSLKSYNIYWCNRQTYGKY